MLVKKSVSFIPLVFALAGCTQTTYWTKPGGNQAEFDTLQASCHRQAYSLPQSVAPVKESGYQVRTFVGGGYVNSIVTPYQSPYQSLSDGFYSLSSSLDNIVRREKFVENCIISNGWRKIQKEKLSVTSTVYATVGQTGEIYEGEATGYLDMTGTIKIKSASGNGCAGNFRYTSSLGGDGLVRCDDGQSAEITFKSLSNLSGYGEGTTDEGHLVRFTYGLDAKEREKYLPLLPSAHRPGL